MGISLIDKIIAKGSAFLGLVDAREVIGGAEGGDVPDDAISESSVTQHEGAITHESVSGAGTNTHTEIDTHIAGEPVVSVSTSTHTLVLGTDIVSVLYSLTGACTVTVDSDNLVNGNRFEIIDAGGLAGTNNITIYSEGTALFNNETSVVINTNNGAVSFVSDGTNYIIRSIS